MRSALLVSALGCAALLGGCGAKTGLRVPDAATQFDAGPGPRDAGRDASRDAGVDAAVPLPCVELPFDGGTIEVDLAIESRLERADVFFLIDTTASMGEEIERVRSRLRDVVAPAIEAQIPDVNLGVGTFADYPQEPFGQTDNGARIGDRPFVLRQPMTPDLEPVQAALDAVTLDNGQDEPEAQVTALYQTMRGDGYPNPRGGTPWIAPAPGCPRGGFGYPCFRSDSVPIILLFTDAAFHNGPSGEFPYGAALATPTPSYAQAVAALQADDVRVIGFTSGGNSRDPLTRLARDTQAVDRSGAPLVFDIGAEGQRLDARVVQAFQDFAAGVILDVDARAQDPAPTDGFDVTQFVQGIVPLRASPADGIGGIDVPNRTFLQVRSGTQLSFGLQLRNDVLMPGDEPRAFELDILFRGDRRTPLGRKRLLVVVPSRDGRGCPR